MELRDFVSETILQIVNGVMDAQSRVDSPGVIISPKISTNLNYASDHGYLWAGSADKGGYAQILKFDVALTVSEGTDKKAGIGVFAAAVSIGGSGSSSATQSSVSRIQFSVPLVLPQNA
jgi:hypothetical protein